MSYTQNDHKELKRFIREYNDQDYDCSWDEFFKRGTADQPTIERHWGWENFAKNLKLEVPLLKINSVQALQALYKKIYAMNEAKAEVNRNQLFPDRNKEEPLDELSEALAQQDRITLRIAAGGDDAKDPQYTKSYSFTEGTADKSTNIIVNLVGPEFNQVRLVHEGDDTFVHVSPSVQLGKLDKKLNKNGFSICDENLTPAMLSLLDRATVGGFLANGGHGTGPTTSISDLVEELTFLLPNGEIKTVNKSDPNFDYMRTHLGLFGTVIDIKMRVAPAKKIACKMDVMSLPEFIEKVEAGFDEPYVSVFYAPVDENDLTNWDAKNVLKFSWRAVDMNTPNVNFHPKFSKAMQKLQIMLAEKTAIMDVLRAHPSVTPYFMKYVVGLFAIGCQDKEMVAPWNEYHYLDAYPFDIDDQSYAEKVKGSITGKKGGKEVADSYRKIAMTHAAFAKKGMYPIAGGGVYTRFMRGAKEKGLTPASCPEDMHIAFTDIVSGRGILGYDNVPEKLEYDSADDYVKEDIPTYIPFKTQMDQYYLDKGAIAHPGKHESFYKTVREMYGVERVDKFIEVLKDHYRQHGMSVANMFTTQYFCNFLELPKEYAPNPNLLVMQAVRVEKEDLFSAPPQVAMAKGVEGEGNLGEKEVVSSETTDKIDRPNVGQAATEFLQHMKKVKAYSTEWTTEAKDALWDCTKELEEKLYTIATPTLSNSQSSILFGATQSSSLNSNPTPIEVPAPREGMTI